ncbi:hypothetical protein POTOM_052558 [Populus tomentosa]|uniref:Glycolipid transfer protein domain-containing protein n=1 Tax=Populus tomentosa TaxID=118781 RepID=A0A8X8C7D5_POPTO|nr:hypothetical protein POTOM_052558 [Populus tomentosa]
MGDLDTAKPLRKIAEAFKELEATINSQSQEVEVAPFSHACSLVSPLFGCLGIAFKFAEVDYVAKVLDLAEASKSIGTLQSLLEKDIQGNSVRKSGSHSRNLLRVKRGLVMVKVLFELIIVTERGINHNSGNSLAKCWWGSRFFSSFSPCLDFLIHGGLGKLIVWVKGFQTTQWDRGLKVYICDVPCTVNLTLKLATSANDFVCLQDETVMHLLSPDQLYVMEQVRMFQLLFLLVQRGNSLKGPASKAYEQVFAPHHGWALRKAVAAGMYALPTKEQLLKNLNEDGECLDHFKCLLMKFMISQVPERKLGKYSNAELCCCIGAGNNVRRETLPKQRIGYRLVNNGLLLKSVYCDCPFSFLLWSININILYKWHNQMYVY